MNKTAYQVWQSLHDRWAQGETLTPKEQTAYEAGCVELDAEEVLPGRLNELRDVRTRAEELEVQFVKN